MLNTYKLYREYKYQFKTENGQDYSIYLEDYKEMLGIPDQLTCEIMYVSVIREEPIKKEVDLFVQDTVVSILIDYLKRYDDIICYICSNSGGLAKARQRLFSKWFRDYNPGTIISKARIINNEEHIFIFDTNNHSAKHFFKSFNSE